MPAYCVPLGRAREFPKYHAAERWQVPGYKKADKLICPDLNMKHPDAYFGIPVSFMYSTTLA